MPLRLYLCNITLSYHFNVLILYTGYHHRLQSPSYENYVTYLKQRILNITLLLSFQKSYDIIFYACLVFERHSSTVFTNGLVL